ncbi:DUF1963 domain-containing protein [Nocardiopsis suaedae]|uniref:DUF1963 domain-containing protein n=1 Tax=Nocardiopsis suaedae TaxID=3018444 RepID=A0ABT4TE61_9ACTN|nr:DUF1963 domain-containing protein [Nocardiopsis suaedae]MDA2802916.1 DUF1963 domain-containing protein [Nocardiopsis suaedae]
MTVEDLRTLQIGRLVPLAEGESVRADDGGPATRLGGQPDWLSEPEWPLASGKAQRFIAQVRLPGSEPRMAYIFMEDDGFGDQDPDLGDLSEYDWNTDVPSTYRVTDSHAPNTVIVQPNGTPRVPTAPVAEGPTLHNIVPGQAMPVAYRVELAPYVPETVEAEVEGEEDVPVAWWSGDAKFDEEEDRPDVQVGGKAFWLQMQEVPDDWHHVATIDSATDKYSINCGDSGLAYAFLNPEQTNGVLITQSC